MGEVRISAIKGAKREQALSQGWRALADQVTISADVVILR